MGVFYTLGERRVRAGVYQRYTNVGGVEYAGAINGIVAAVIKADWGPLNTVVTLENENQVNEIFGYGGTTDVLREIFRGGAIKVFAVRIGTGGTKGTATLKDGAATDVLTLNNKYEGARTFSYTVRPLLGDATRKEFILLEDAEVLEKYTVNATGAIDALVEALSGSSYVEATKLATGDGTLADVAQASLSAGTDVTNTTTNYSTAFNLLEPYVFNVITVDTNDTDVHVLLAAFANRIYAQGTMNFAIVAEPLSVDFETRLNHATAFNDYNIIYFGHGWKDITGKLYDGFLAAARLAGVIAATPSNETVTRRVIQYATELPEMLTNDQAERAIKGGMVTLRALSTGAIAVEKGVTTLVNPAGQDDEGWKKIKRCKVRFEAFQRISDTLEKYIGIPNDEDSWALIVQTIRGILREMEAERKIRRGSDARISPVYLPEGESAWFDIILNDIDSLEVIYLNYQLRFSPNR